MAILGVPKAICSYNDIKSKMLDKIFNHLRIDHRLSNPYQPTGNGIAEASVKATKNLLMKRFLGKEDQWDLYLNSTAIALNMAYSRAPNMFSDINIVVPFSSKDIKPALIEAKIREVQDIIIPALRAKIEDRHLRDHQYFMQRNRIIEPYPVGSKVMLVKPVRNSKIDLKFRGPFIVVSVTKGGSYILTSAIKGAMLPRPVSKSQLKLVSKENVHPGNNDDIHYEVEAVVDHRGDDPETREYRVRWKHYDNEEEDTWEPIKNFDSVTPIREYLKKKGLLDNSKAYKEKRIMKKYNRLFNKATNDDTDSPVENEIQEIEDVRPSKVSRKRSRRGSRRS
ncbi:unnamed protein product [Mucor hiemalis]